MKRIVVILAIVGVLFSCNDNDLNEININEQNYLVFGHFYGMCGGEDCVETFKLTNTTLFEDIIDDYSGVDMDFIELEKDKYEQTKDLINYFPNKLLNQKETTFGCPDCADGGGLFIQYSENGNIKSWRIDQDKNNVPEYLHKFMDKVNEKIALLKE
ncbi:hypothetical protein [Tenacibaculum crassostreae]|uniref:hypothetical protein n=1 Tax=Tenacibaculum crassostreae TaxID=502683 RepID=UPI003894C58D